MDLISCIIPCEGISKTSKEFLCMYVCNLIRVSRSFSVSKLCTYVSGAFFDGTRERIRSSFSCKTTSLSKLSLTSELPLCSSRICQEFKIVLPYIL